MAECRGGAVSARPVVLALSRQLGCGGSYLGRLVARRLGWRYLDREVLRRAALELGLPEGEVADREERLTPFWEQDVRWFCHGVPEGTYVPPPLPVVPDEALFRVEAQILRQVAAEGSCVVVGKGAAHVLRDCPGLLSVFLHAAPEFRAARVMRLYGIGDPAEARALVDDSDRRREHFHRALAGGEWTDARRYDLCLDTGRVGFIEAREILLGLVAKARRED